MPSTWPANPKTTPDCSAATGGLANDSLRLDEVDLAQPGGAGEERVHRDLDSGGEDAADVLAVGGHDVEVRRRPEVDHDARSAVPLGCRYGIRDSIGADLTGVVIPNGDACLDARADLEQLGGRVPLGELAVRPDELGNGRRERYTEHL
jgi:hypothetical protein